MMESLAGWATRSVPTRPQPLVGMLRFATLRQFRTTGAALEAVQSDIQLGSRWRIDLQRGGADAVGCPVACRFGEMRGENVDALPIITDLRGPKVFDLMG